MHLLACRSSLAHLQSRREPPCGRRWVLNSASDWLGFARSPRLCAYSSIRKEAATVSSSPPPLGVAPGDSEMISKSLPSRGLLLRECLPVSPLASSGSSEALGLLRRMWTGSGVTGAAPLSAADVDSVTSPCTRCAAGVAVSAAVWVAVGGAAV